VSQQVLGIESRTIDVPLFEVISARLEHLKNGHEKRALLLETFFLKANIPSRMRA